MQSLAKGVAKESTRILTSTRSLHASVTVRNEPTQLSTKTVTKRNYDTLPTERVLADGTILQPLPTWHGGLEASDTPVISVSPLIEIRANQAQQTVKPPRKPRTRKLKEGDPEVTASPRKSRSQKQTAVGSSSAPPPRRAKKGAIVSDVPQNQLASEIFHNLGQYPNCILFTRVGKFYESYFEQAMDVSVSLNIKLSHRTWGGHRVLSCGFPVLQLDKYLKILVQQNKKFVAICEELPRGPDDKGNFERRVVRVVTPGTLIDESFVNQYENNYLLAITGHLQSDTESSLPASSPVGLAWIDVSTGEFFTKTSSLGALCDELARIGPREVVLEDACKGLSSHPLRKAIVEEGCFTSYIALEDSSGSSLPEGSPQAPTFIVASPMPATETSAVSLLTTYMKANLLDSMPVLGSPRREVEQGRMQIDAHTIKALEIRESISDGGTASSLLNVIKRTVTSSGARLLARWLCSPSTSVSDITLRQSLVAFWHARPHLRTDLIHALANVEDVTRIVQKFTVERGDAGDMSALAKSITVWASIRNNLLQEKEMEISQQEIASNSEWASMNALLSRLGDFTELSAKISSAIVRQDLGRDGREVSTTLGAEDQLDSDVDDNEETNLKQEKWSIRPEYTEKLKALHVTLESLVKERWDLENSLQKRFHTPSLTLRNAPGTGLVVHIGKTKRDGTKLPSPEFVRLTERAGTAAFFHEPWSRIGTQTAEMMTAIGQEEKEAFHQLRKEIIMEATKLRQNARTLDEIDVTLAFSALATDMNFVRPSIEEDSSYTVVNGRHPTVELGLLSSGRSFTPNTVSFTESSKVHILTGPNMAGKSTLLRQTALIAILAQIGCYVPAEYASIGIVDKLFSRIGAKDDLFRDRSTFMVEMLETAEILRRATPRSLVIMDEVGRGTTVKDGLAIAFATVHHVTTENRCRTLFATHFHELSDMLGYSANNKGQGVFKNVSFECTDVDETGDGHFAYSYRLRPGVNRDSHGLKVAQLAGMPDSVVKVAKGALTWLKGKKEGETIKAKDLALLGRSLSEPPTFIN